MKLPRLASATLSSILFVACGQKAPPAPKAAPDAAASAPGAPGSPGPVAMAPSEPAPYTVTYTYKAKVDGPSLLFRMSADGKVEAVVQSPPTRYVGKAEDLLVGDIGRLLAETAVRALPETSADGATPIIEVELQDAKGALWRRHFTGQRPAVAGPLFDRLENLQGKAKREDRPPGVLKVVDTRTDPAGGPTEVLTVDANSLVLVTVDGKPKALGRVGTSDLDDLRVACGLLEGLRPVPGGKGKRHALHIERGDRTTLELTVDGAPPLATEWLFAKLAELEAGAKPVALFDKITYRLPRAGKDKKGHELLTVLPTGALTLATLPDNAALAAGETAIEELWGVHAALVPLEALPVGTTGKGGELTLRVEGPTGVREIRTTADAPTPEAKKLINYMNRFVVQLEASAIPTDPK